MLRRHLLANARVDGRRVAGRDGRGRPSDPGAASAPKTIRSNFRFSVLLSKPSIGAASTMVTSSPFFTAAFVTAAHVSPSAVFRRM